jgi:pimeloyl-ACP methyl ester carboxylesterase
VLAGGVRRALRAVMVRALGTSLPGILGAALVVSALVIGPPAAAATPDTSAAASSAAPTGAPTGAPTAAPTNDPPDGPRVLTREAAEARWADAASKFVELDGIRLHYKDEGRGPVLLLVHGSFGDLGDWDGWVAALRDRWRVVRFDRPGAGLTGPVANGNYSLDRQLALVDALMDRLGVERFAIAGASLGGPVAYRYASTRTDRVAALVLLNSAGIEYGGRQGTTRAPPPSSYGWSTAPTVSRAEVRQTLATIINDPAKLTDAFVERKFQLHAIAGRDEEAVATIRLYERGTPERLLARVVAPSLVLWGSGNRALSTQTADAFVAALVRAPVASKVVYEGAGHMIHVERPTQTVADAAAFLDRYARGTGAPRDAMAAHWARAEGTWSGEAGYLDGALAPNVARYGALLQLRREGSALAQTEWKFYPASPLARQMAAALAGATLAESEGLALVTASRGTPAADGALDFGAEAGAFVAAGSGSAVGTVGTVGTVGGEGEAVGEFEAVRYRMLYTFPSPDRMVRTTLGFASDGTLKGISVFRYRRIDAGALDAERRRLEQEFGVAAEIDRAAGTPVLRRLRR